MEKSIKELEKQWEVKGWQFSFDPVLPKIITKLKKKLIERDKNNHK